MDSVRTMDAVTTAAATASMSYYSPLSSWSPIFGLSSGICVIVVTVLVAILQKHIQRLQTKKPFGNENKTDDSKESVNIPMPPNSHWLFGHIGVLKRMFDGTVHMKEFHKTNEFGQLSLWITARRVLIPTSIEDARTILHSEYNRVTPPFIGYHVRMFLGSKNITLLQGREWKLNRSAIYRSLGPSTLQRSRTAMIHVAKTMVQSLLERMKIQNNNSNTNDTNSVTMDVESLMKMITVDVFGLSALSQDLKCSKNLKSSKIALAFEYLLDDFSHRLSTPFSIYNYLYSLPTYRNRQHYKHRTILRTFLYNLIQERLLLSSSTTTTTEYGSNQSGNTGGKQQDLLSHIIQANQDIMSMNEDNSNKISSSIINNDNNSKTRNNESRRTTNDRTNDMFLESTTNQILSDTLLAILFAGYDTTSVTLTCALYYISQHPDIEKNCLEEISALATGGGGGGDVVDDDETDHAWTTDNLVYCRAVIHETLRLHPPGTFTSRFTTKPIPLSGNFTLPEKCGVFIPIQKIHLDERYFERPHEFRPDRWVMEVENTCASQDASSSSKWNERECSSKESHPNTKTGGNGGCNCTIKAANRNAFLAFSAGGRSCPGQSFAIQEASLVLAVLLKHLKFETIQGKPNNHDGVLNMARTGIVQHPKGGLYMEIRARD